MNNENARAKLLDIENRTDLDFKPAGNNPKTLNRQQIDFYNENGYLMPIDIFNPLETERNRTYFDYLLASMKAYNDGRDSYAINGYQALCQGLYDIGTDKRIVDLVEDIIGPDVVLWGTHFFCKLPFDPKSVPWHQDASYWPVSPARTVTAWLAIDDVDEENSAMQFIPKTHNKGHLKFKKLKEKAAAGLDQEIDNVAQYGDPVYDCLKAGQISLHADMLAHGSQANKSARRRCGLVIRYCSAASEPVDREWGTQSVIVRGSDSNGWWANNPRPAGENIASKYKPKSIGGN